MKKVALITGITGQDGSFLAEFLLQKDYEVKARVGLTTGLYFEGALGRPAIMAI